MPDSDATEDLMEKVRHLPRTSGVYIFKDIFGRVIYIGKAVNLRRRVSSYFMPSGKDKAYNPKIASLKKSRNSREPFDKALETPLQYS